MIFVNGFYYDTATNQIVRVISTDEKFVTYEYFTGLKATSSIDVFNRRFRFDG